MNVLSLFDGIACGKEALDRLGVRCNYYASEINKYAIQVTKNKHPEVIQLGDIRELDTSKLPNIDLILAGSPCQSLSLAGNRRGFKDPRGELFWEFVRVLREIDPDHFLFENVKMKRYHEHVITKSLGVDPILINSELVSAQNRDRLYWTNIPGIRQPEDREIYLDDVIGRPVYAAAKRKVKGGEIRLDVQEKNKSYCVVSSFSDQKNGVIDGDFRELTPEECEKLQTLPVGYTEGLSKGQRIRLIGEAWTVEVIAHILGFAYG